MNGTSYGFEADGQKTLFVECNGCTGNYAAVGQGPNANRAVVCAAVHRSGSWFAATGCPDSAVRHVVYILHGSHL
ncbi:MAG: hypothetical protein OXT09_18440 [Myxococcales bacterium]|nr:hypothetical protein [Myxococcales bacterium]